MKSFKVLNEFLGDISIHTQRCSVKGDSKLGNVNLKVDECVETLKCLDSAFFPFQYHVNQVEDEFLVLIRWVWQLCDCKSKRFSKAGFANNRCMGGIAGCIGHAPCSYGPYNAALAGFHIFLYIPENGL